MYIKLFAYLIIPIFGIMYHVLENKYEYDAELQDIIKQLSSLSLDELNSKLNDPVFSKQLRTSVAVISHGSTGIDSLSSSFLQLPEQCWSNNPDNPKVKLAIGVIIENFGRHRPITELIKKLDDPNKLKVIMIFGNDKRFYGIDNIEEYPTIKFFYPTAQKVSVPLCKLHLVRNSFVSRHVTKYVLNVTPKCRESTDLGSLDLEFSEYVEQVKIEFPVSENQQSIGIRSLNAPNLKFLKIGNKFDNCGDYKVPILISRVGKLGIRNLQDFQLLNVGFNNFEGISTGYDFSFLNHLERGSFFIHGKSKRTYIELFNSFKDTLKVLEIFNCLDVLQMVQSVRLSNLKFLLLEYCNRYDLDYLNEDDMEPANKKVEEYFKAINEMDLPSLSSISLRTLPIANLEALKRLINYKFAIKELAWVFELYGKQLLDFNTQLNSLSQWLPNLKDLILRAVGENIGKFECFRPFVLSNIKLDVESFYFYAKDWTINLHLKNLDAPNLLSLSVINEKHLVTADSEHQLMNINAPKLERLEIEIDSEVTITPSSLIRFPELKIFILHGWLEQELKLGNDKLEVFDFSESRLHLEGNLPALKKLICDDVTKKILEQNNVDVSNWREPSHFSTSISYKPEVDQEMDKCVGSFFTNNRLRFYYF